MQKESSLNMSHHFSISLGQPLQIDCVIVDRQSAQSQATEKNMKTENIAKTNAHH